MTREPAPHPAKFSDRVLATIEPWLHTGWLVLDPFGGVGKLTNITKIHAICVEIEAEWAVTGIVGNALLLPFPDNTFPAVVTSPCYGNRMADHHDAKDPCKPCDGTGLALAGECKKCRGKGVTRRHTYRHTLGRPLHGDNSGQMQWGELYRAFHRNAWLEADRVLKPGGTFILNISDHWRGNAIARVTKFHLDYLEEQLGYRLVADLAVATPRNRHGANRTLRVDHETVAVFRKPKPKEEPL